MINIPVPVSERDMVGILRCGASLLLLHIKKTDALYPVSVMFSWFLLLLLVMQLNFGHTTYSLDKIVACLSPSYLVYILGVYDSNIKYLLLRGSYSFYSLVC